MDYFEKILSLLEEPYFHNLRSIGVDERYYHEILSKLYNDNITIIDFNHINRINDNNGNEVYIEYPDGYWRKLKYNTKIYTIYYENSEGLWIKQEFDDNGGIIYRETSSDGILLDIRNK
jgi:hypothetical protein